MYHSILPAQIRPSVQSDAGGGGEGGGRFANFFAFPPAEKCPYDDIGHHAACRTQLHKGHRACNKNSQDDHIIL
jgi:hypothetical protein